MYTCQNAIKIWLTIEDYKFTAYTVDAQICQTLHDNKTHLVLHRSVMSEHETRVQASLINSLEHNTSVHLKLSLDKKLHFCL